MARPPHRPSAAGGFPIAMGAILGTVAGLALGQPTIGFLGGLAVGVLIAVMVWVLDR